MTKLVLVTGKTGVGKTYLLKKYGYKKTVYLDDYVTNVLYHKDHPVFKKVVAFFGRNIITKHHIDKIKLGKVVINNLDQLEILATIVNPQIRHYLKSLKNGVYVIEMATYLKYENYFKDLFYKVILITTKNPYLQNKFTYINKKIVIIKKNNIQYDHLIDKDKKGYENLFFKLLDKLLIFK